MGLEPFDEENIKMYNVYIIFHHMIPKKISWYTQNEHMVRQGVFMSVSDMILTVCV